MKPVLESLTPTMVEMPSAKMNYAKGSGTISSHTKTTVPVKKK